MTKENSEEDSRVRFNRYVRPALPQARVDSFSMATTFRYQVVVSLVRGKSKRIVELAAFRRADTGCNYSAGWSFDRYDEYYMALFFHTRIALSRFVQYIRSLLRTNGNRSVVKAKNYF